MQRPEQILRQVPGHEPGITYIMMLRGHSPAELLPKFEELARLGAEIDVKIMVPASLVNFATPSNLTLPYGREVSRIWHDERVDSFTHD